jgi:DNA polymerase V
MELKISKLRLDKLNDKYNIVLFAPKESGKEHPVAESAVSAGFPAYAENFKTDPISIDRFLINRPESSFILKVQGESMLDAGIFPDAYIVADTSLPPTDKRIVLVRLEDEFLVKRIRIFDDYAVLKAENNLRDYPDIRIDSSADFEIWGTVIGTFQKL